LQEGADEYTLLHLAAEISLPEYIEVLLAFDIDVNIRSKVSVLGCDSFLARLVKCKLIFIFMYFKY